MSTILDADFDNDYDSAEDEDFVVTAEDLARDDDDEDALQAYKLQKEREKLKKQIKTKATAGAEILSDDDVDLFELPPEVEEDDLSHLQDSEAQLDPEELRRRTIEEQVMSARVSKAFDELNQGKDFSGSLASLCRSSTGSKKKSTKRKSAGGKTSADLASILGKRKASSPSSSSVAASSPTAAESESTSGASTSADSAALAADASGDAPAAEDLEIPDLPTSGGLSLGSLTSSKKKSAGAASGSGSVAKRQKIKKTLNSWELPVPGPIKVEEIVESLETTADAPDSAPEAKSEVVLPVDGQVLTGEQDRYLVKDVAEFAGEKIEVVRELSRGSAAERSFLRKTQKSRLEKLVDGLEGGNAELSTIEKSSWDWQRDKREVGDAQELEQAAKDGFVAKQAFLLEAEERQLQRLKLQQRLAAGANR